MERTLDISRGRKLEPILRDNQSFSYYARNNTMEDIRRGLNDNKKQHVFQLDSFHGGDQQQFYHKNYLDYLVLCWKIHRGAVITPDIVWHILLSEIAIEVADNVESYRSLFTDSDKKKEILVNTDDPYVLPLDEIEIVLRELVPTNIDMFLPTFSTSTPESKFVQSAAFADICSPYYNYSMFCCGIPHIIVEGNLGDWNSLSNRFHDLAKIINHTAKSRQWAIKVGTVLDDIVTHLNDEEYFAQMIRFEKCGSGSDLEAHGWITELFATIPNGRQPQNFSSCVSQVKYKNISTDQKYVMKAGLFNSFDEDEKTLDPVWSYIVYNDKSE